MPTAPKFIELPRVDYQGRPIRSAYVNVEHIIAFEADWDAVTTKVTVNNFGSQGHGIINTILPLESLVQNLHAGDWGEDLRARFHQRYQEHLARGIEAA